MNLYIYSYNNYYNRLVKKAGDNVQDYVQWLHYGPVQGVYGFTPGDGINTTQVIGTIGLMYDGKGDYLIAHDPQTNEIDSRWFIIDVNRTRDGQWILTLHRDLVVDYYNQILESPMYIEKATLTATNPLIYNKEGITVNLIKTRETQLKDSSGCAWLVGYYDPNHTDEADPESILVSQTQDAQPYDIAMSIPFNEWQYQTVINSDVRDIYYNAKVNLSSRSNYVEGYYDYQFALGPSYTAKTKLSSSHGDSGFYIFEESSDDLPTAEEFRKLMKTPLSLSLLAADSAVVSLLNANVTDEMAQYKDLTLRFPKPEGEVGYDYYKISSTTSEVKATRVPITNNTGRLSLILWDQAEKITSATVNPDHNGTFSYSCTYTQTVYTVAKIVSGTNIVKIPKTANKPLDAPYGIFCIPCPDEGRTFKLKFESSSAVTVIMEMSRQSSLDIAMELSRKYSGGNVIYDIQLLPYCPMATLQLDPEDPSYVIFEEFESQQNSYSFITDADNQRVGIIFYPPYASFTKNLSYSISVDNVKLENECDMYRLVSPNYDGQFEFNAAKNGGVQWFNVDCTYLPYTPYIHVNPNFSNLYGKDFNDARGLVCGGDFSLPQMSDQWESYKIQNKNYQAAFDREIQNMNVQHDVQRTQEKWNVAAGALTGLASGALAGSMVGGGAGAVIGGIVGTGLSVAGGIQDIKLNELLRGEALDYKTDMFGYQLANVKALPNSIMKTTAYTYNNKIYPILEYYTCTEQEKKAIASKIAWNGMTVMAIGTFKDYIGADWSYDTIESKGYIKGKLIRLNFFDETSAEPHKQGMHSEDYHVINAISGELDKGVYIQ